MERISVLIVKWIFLDRSYECCKQVADNAQLTTNNHVIEPQPGVITGWNDYFEMYSQPSLANVPEVLLWKQYSFSLSISHDAAYRVKTGCADGYTRTFAESFLMKNGLPIMPAMTIRVMSALIM